MSETLDDVLKKWAVSQVCPNTGETATEYEFRAVKNLMYFGLKLLREAQPVISEFEAELAQLKEEKTILEKELLEERIMFMKVKRLLEQQMGANMNTEIEEKNVSKKPRYLGRFYRPDPGETFEEVLKEIEKEYGHPPDAIRCNGHIYYFEIWEGLEEE